MFYDGNDCQGCNGNQFATIWQGRIKVIAPEKSDIAKEMEMKKEGEYAIQFR